MAESSSPQKPLQPPVAGGESIPSAGTPNHNLASPHLHASPSMDLPQISSSQLPQPQPQAAASASPLDYAPKQSMQPQQQQFQPSMQQLQQNQQHQQNLVSSTSNFQVQAAAQRSGSIPRISQLHQQFGPTVAASAMRQHAGGIYGGQMNFAGQQYQQQMGGVSRPGMMSQAGQLSMLSGQSVNVQAQMLAQSRQKMNLVQGSQFLPTNTSGTGLQGMPAMGLIGSLSMNSQLRANGALAYSQQRLGQAQMRQQSLPQQLPLTSTQLSGQNLSRSTSIAATNPQLPGLVQNGQALVQSPASQVQWLKQMQTGISGPISPSYNIEQQQKQQPNFLPQQLSSSQLKQMGLNQQQVSQLVQQQQQQPLLSNQQQRQQQLEQLQPLQMHKQQQSPRLSATAPLQKPPSLSGSEQHTAANNAATPSGSSGHVTEPGSQLLGKRRIEDLVSQVDSLAQLDPDVVDILLEMADDFIDSVTTFACKIAQHRKSSLLEAKDVLLHLEKNWQLKVPGFTRDEQQDQRKSLPSDIHSKRLKTIRALMESQKVEIYPGHMAPTKNIASEPSVSRSMQSSPNVEQLILPAPASQMLHKIPRF